jgi:uncharacterized protein (TIGR00255 family)
MTAYAGVERMEDGLTVRMEMRSYNSRHLDVVLRIPGDYLIWEDKIKKIMSETIKRGRIELRMTIQNEADEADAYEVNTGKAKAYRRALEALKADLDMTSDVSIELIAGEKDIIRPKRVDKDMEAEWPLVSNCLRELLIDLDGMRRREGEYIENDFHKRLDAIEEWIAQIEKKSEGLLEVYQERLMARITLLTKDTVAVDPERIAQEAAFLANKSDISEELVRARSHVKQFREIMRSHESSGQKLNFLLQEFNREFSTIASKTGHSDVSHIVVNVKTELEKLREQVQNIE